MQNPSDFADVLLARQQMQPQMPPQPRPPELQALYELLQMALNDNAPGRDGSAPPYPMSGPVGNYGSGATMSGENLMMLKDLPGLFGRGGPPANSNPRPPRVR